MCLEKCSLEQFYCKQTRHTNKHINSSKLVWPSKEKYLLNNCNRKNASLHMLREQSYYCLIFQDLLDIKINIIIKKNKNRL